MSADACPHCGQPGLPLLFGLPVEEAASAAEHGELALAGCVTEDDAQNRECPGGHRWLDEDTSGWDDEALAALLRHGYKGAL